MPVHKQKPVFRCSPTLWVHSGDEPSCCTCAAKAASPKKGHSMIATSWFWGKAMAHSNAPWVVGKEVGKNSCCILSTFVLVVAAIVIKVYWLFFFLLRWISCAVFILVHEMRHCRGLWSYGCYYREVGSWPEGGFSSNLMITKNLQTLGRVMKNISAYKNCPFWFFLKCFEKNFRHKKHYILPIFSIFWDFVR